MYKVTKLQQISFPFFASFAPNQTHVSTPVYLPQSDANLTSSSSSTSSNFFRIVFPSENPNNYSSFHLEDYSTDLKLVIGTNQNDSNSTTESETYSSTGGFDSFPEWVVILWTMILVSVMVLGIFGNVLVPVVVLRTRDLKTSTNFLLVNLAVADILVLVVCLPTALTELHTKPDVWVLGEFLCKYWRIYKVRGRTILQ